ncbi:type II toxin-antitoxin system HicB family antitoxin [Chloroflexota bacterium]
MWQVIMIPAEEGGFTVECPLLSGCISEGDTYEEALANIKEAISLYLEDMRDAGEEVPQPRIGFTVATVAAA